jgi:hypothetical protein
MPENRHQVKGTGHRTARYFVNFKQGNYVFPVFLCTQEGVLPQSQKRIIIFSIQKVAKSLPEFVNESQINY